MNVNMSLPICYFIILKRSPPVPFGVYLVWGKVLEDVKQIQAYKGIYLLNSQKDSQRHKKWMNVKVASKVSHKLYC